MNCPLCLSSNTEGYINSDFKDYYKCDICGLVFINSDFHLQLNEEKSHYSFHNNSIDDDKYVKFLNRVIIPARKYIKQGDEGLDFGCGPNPVLSQLIKNTGNDCDFYDPLFFPYFPEKQYNFVFATECFEHFFSPYKELNAILTTLKTDGILAIMTELIIDKNNFADWYYIKDPTHVCFYSLKTFEFIAEKYGLNIVYTDNVRVVVLKRES